MAKNVRELEENKINRLILSYSLPAIIGMLVMASYNIVDRIFVGRGVGTLAISGIAITFPINILILGFGQLIGMGAMALISIKLGEKKKEEAEQILGNAFLLVFIISAALSLAIYFSLHPLLYLLGGSGEVHDYALAYMNVIVWGIPFQFISFAMNGIIRAEGDPNMALFTILISGILNIIINPIFIFILHLGIRGSALATVVSQFIGAIFVMIYFSSNRSYLNPNWRKISLNLQVVLKIFSIGVSPFVMQVAGSVIIFLFNRALLQYGGDIAVAAMGIGNSIMMIIMMPIFGLNQGIQPIIGYNYGARKIHRVKETLKKGIFIASTICLAGFFVILFFSSNIVAVFNANDPQLIKIGSHGLLILLIMLPLNGFQVVSWAYFQAVGKPKQAMMLTLTKQILLLIPLIIILPQLFKLDGVWMSVPIADFLSAVMAGTLLLVETKRLRTYEYKKVEKERFAI